MKKSLKTRVPRKDTSPPAGRPAEALAPTPPSTVQNEEPQPTETGAAQSEEAKSADAQATRDPATALRNLLIDRLNVVTAQHDDDGRKAVEADRSIFRLMVQVKTWAAALVDACHAAGHSRAADYAEIHGDAIEGALLRALAQHLGLPTDQDLFNEPWPESNGVSEFVLEIADAPVDWTPDRPAIMSYRLLRERRLPRWQRKGPEGRATFARRPETDTLFLSVEETEKALRDLEKSFRDVLINGSQSWSDEADLARRRFERAQPQKPREYRFHSPLAQAVSYFLATNKLPSDTDIDTYLQNHHRGLRPKRWDEGDGYDLPGKYFTRIRRTMGLSKKKTAR